LTLNRRRKLKETEYISYTLLECTNRADQQTRKAYKNTTYTEVLVFMRVITVVRKTDEFNRCYSSVH
jgi:hypothetical protein